MDLQRINENNKFSMITIFFVSTKMGYSLKEDKYKNYIDKIQSDEKNKFILLSD